MSKDKTGRIIWHDLFTGDRARSMSYYKQLANWEYITEHASDFAWGGGEKDFVLALLNGEAGAGIAERPEGLENSWIVYVEVPDVDKVAVHADSLGATILKAPFDVPGVGRNCLLRDPSGALIGVSVSEHNFPTPTKQFSFEVYLSGEKLFPQAFYENLFGWHVTREPNQQFSTILLNSDGSRLGIVLPGGKSSKSQSTWLPLIKQGRTKPGPIEPEGAIGAEQFSGSASPIPILIIQDPDGTKFAVEDRA